ncbi:MAG: BON domain-containing protein, partial [Blastocatellia bacterium]
AGEVTLSGIVGTREEKRLAESVAEACPGAKAIRNRLRVHQANQNQDDLREAPAEGDAKELFQ